MLNPQNVKVINVRKRKIWEMITVEPKETQQINIMYSPGTEKDIKQK